jgi:opacity protein-like surface antigen
MLSGVASGATDGSEVDYGREYNPYVTLRGGWLFGGDVGFSDCAIQLVAKTNGDRKESLKSAWSGSGEFGVSLCEDRVLVGLELGCFTGKARYEFDDNEKSRYGAPFTMIWGNGSYVVADGKYKNLFAAVNVTLKRDVGERAFLYGGVGAGMARSDFGELNSEWDDAGVWVTGKIDFKSKWRFLGQVFAGVGIYLDDNWSLGIGYRMRYLTGDVNGSKGYTGDVQWDWKVKQDLSHAVEVGLTYQF